MSMHESSTLFFFFQAEDGIRDAQESRGLGDVYKRQIDRGRALCGPRDDDQPLGGIGSELQAGRGAVRRLSLIHI